MKEQRVREIISEMVSKKQAYLLDLSGHHGASADFEWKDQVLLKQGSETNCVGATTELLFRILKEEGFEDVLSFDDMKDLLSYCFVHDYEDRLWGVAKGIEVFGLGVAVQSFDELRFGDFGQLWHINKNLPKGIGRRNSHYLGHSVMFTSRTGENLEFIEHFSAADASNGMGFRELLANRKFETGHQRQWRFSRLSCIE